MATSYLSRTITPSTINKKRFTFSAWVKIDNLTAEGDILSFNGSTDYTALRIKNADRIDFITYDGGVNARRVSTAKYRDCSAFYHVVLSVNSDDATADDRIKIYVNGERLTAFDSSVNPSSGFEFINNNKVNLNIGSNVDQTPTRWYFGGIMSHVHFIDGLTYDASAFGETDVTTGIWKPITAPSVTYGTNGFFLKGENSGALGTDSSGNGNDFTINGTPTQTVDTPSNVFATMNPLYRTTNINFSNGNNTITSSSGSWNAPASTLAASTGKWYVEGKTTGYNHNAVGVASNPNDNSAGYPFEIAGGYGYKLYTGGTTTQGADNVSYGDTLANGDIFQIALDLDNSKIYFGKNGTWQNSGVPTSGATGTGAAFTLPSNETYHFVNALNLQTGGASSQWNFGNGYFGTTAVASAGTSTSGDDSIWEYDCPTGYYGLNTKNINEQEYS